MSYSAASGDRVYGGSSIPERNAENITFSWPPGSNCTIPDAEGVNAPIHPKVLDTGGFGGYRYWMAYTPYPGGDDTKENPSVVASSDGDTWVAPATNPIEPAPSGVSTGYLYHADTHLAFVGGTMYLFFLLNESTGYYSGTRTTTLYCRTSTNGTSWTAKQVVIETVTTDTVPLLSPSISYYDGEWWLWTYDSATDPTSCKLRKSSSLFDTWADPITCTLALSDALREPWHFDVCRIPNGWAMLISDRRRSDNVSGHIWFAYSEDGVVWRVRDGELSTASPNTYRSSIVPSGAGFDAWITDWDARKIRRLRIDSPEV